MHAGTPTTGSGCISDGNTLRPQILLPAKRFMNSPRRILIVQTAFLGDVVLTLPLVQVLHRTFPGAEIDILAIPEVSEVLQNHPAIHRVIAYDKHKIFNLQFIFECIFYFCCKFFRGGKKR